MCIYVCVWSCLDKYISVATWPPHTKIPGSAPASKYRSMVGALQYLPFTCPDLAFSVSLCNIIPLLIWRLQSVSYAMLEVLYTLASISLQVPLLYQPSQMRTGLETLLIGNPQLVCWSSLVPIPSHGPPRNSPPFLVLPQRWNIVLWPQQLLSCHSFVPCSRSLICSFITFQSFNVIISQLLPWLQIQFFIPGPSTLRLIIILSEKRL